MDIFKPAYIQSYSNNAVLVNPPNVSSKNIIRANEKVMSFVVGEPIGPYKGILDAIDYFYKAKSS